MTLPANEMRDTAKPREQASLPPADGQLSSVSQPQPESFFDLDLDFLDDSNDILCEWGVQDLHPHLQGYDLAEFGFPLNVGDNDPHVSTSSAAGVGEQDIIQMTDLLSDRTFVPHEAFPQADSVPPGLGTSSGGPSLDGIELEAAREMLILGNTTKKGTRGAPRKKLPTLAPKLSLTSRAGVSKALAGLKAKPGRKRYNNHERNETAAVRSIGGCIRCRTQRIRCIRDPDDPLGACLPCKTSRPRMSRLPCLRYKISDSILNRTGLDYLAFYRNHPMVGERYGDFNLVRDWVTDAEYSLPITQDAGSVCHLRVRQFNPPVEPTALDLKGRPMYEIPFAIVDADEATAAIETFLDSSVELYLDNLLDDTDHVIFDVFHAALRLSVFPTPDPLLRNVLRLWTACRFIEGRWRCCGEYNVGAERLRNPFRPPDWISPPPYIDYQVGSIIMQRIIAPLRSEILAELQSLVYANKPQNWFKIFIIVFILLHNYELGVRFQVAFAAKRKASVVYLDMPLIRGIQSGAKTILAHFHSVCKGQLPFSPDFDWNSPAIRRMANLDKEQINLLQKLRLRISFEDEYMSSINHSDRYAARLWFISQLFEKDWKPRDTLEHSPDTPACNS